MTVSENQDISGVIITGSHTMMTAASEWIDNAGNNLLKAFEQFAARHLPA